MNYFKSIQRVHEQDSPFFSTLKTHGHVRDSIQVKAVYLTTEGVMVTTLHRNLLREDILNPRAIHIYSTKACQTTAELEQELIGTVYCEDPKLRAIIEKFDCANLMDIQDEVQTLVEMRTKEDMLAYFKGADIVIREGETFPIDEVVAETFFTTDTKAPTDVLFTAMLP